MPGNEEDINMGGRGASSIGQNSRTGKASPFYDKTQDFVGMSLHEFENAVRDKKHEYIGLFDKDGKLIVAGTSFNTGSVAIPTNHPGFAQATTLTHNHPYSAKRPIGGTFSEADVANHAKFGFNQSRAVTNGRNENTYIIRKKAGAKSNPEALGNYVSKVGSKDTLRKMANKGLRKAENTAKSKGKTLTQPQKTQVAIGSIKEVWKNEAVTKAGYEYIEVKKARW